MSLNYQYPDYRDSGISWLGRVPAHWNVTKLKHEAPFQVGWTPPTKNDANFEGDNLWANISDLKSKVILDTAKRISDDAAAAASMEITPKGSLLYSFKLSVGAVAFAGTDMYTNEAIASFLDNSRLPLDYLYYVFPIFVIQNAATNIYGARILNQDSIKNADLLAPSFEEASQIAKFLDYETAKIDALIEKQQQLIALLKEKRQAVISHAVTKGLTNSPGANLNAEGGPKGEGKDCPSSPGVPMRDSGVEWLGEVPAHWEIIQFRHLITGGTRNGLYKPEDKKDLTGCAFIQMGEAFAERVFLGGAKERVSTHQGEHDRWGLHAGDLLFARRSLVLEGSGRCTRIGEIAEPHLFESSMIRVRPRASIVNPAFLHYQFDSSIGRAQMIATTKTVTISGIDSGQLKSVRIVVPPIAEQVEISTYIDLATERVDRVVAKALALVQLLAERRKALISAAVTGKIDVRGWKAPESEAEAEVA